MGLLRDAREAQRNGLPYPDLMDRDADVPPMIHILDQSDVTRFLCGVRRKPLAPPVRWMKLDAIDCVVCLHLRGGSQ